MTNERSIGYEAIRRRFPWVGFVDTGERDLSARYREIMARSRGDRETGRWVMREGRTP